MAAAEKENATRSGGGPRSLALLVPRLARAAIGKHGFSEAGLLADWASIAGEEIAAHAQPERLEFPRGERLEGTLHLRVEGPWALALQHLEPQLVERINASRGYRAVARLRLQRGRLHGHPGRPAPIRPPVQVDAQARAALAAQVADIADGALRRAVERLGLALLARVSARAPTKEVP